MRRFRILTLLILAGLFCLDLYRAATQSIVHDEALTWQMYLSNPFSTIFTFYDANNHFLHTLLQKWVTGIFGYSEFVMRVPALASAALFLWSVFRLGLLVFGESWLLPLFAILAAANPLVLDFQVAARGYGMALALFFFALERMVRFLAEPPDRRLLWHAAAALSLSVMANLVFLFPAAVLAASFAAVFPKAAPSPDRKPKRGSPGPPPSLRRDFFAPIGGLAVLFLLTVPLGEMSRDKFYVGLTNLKDSAETLARQMVAHNDGLGGLNKFGEFQYKAAQVVGWWLAPLLLAAGIFFSRKPRTAPQAALWLASTTAAGSVALLVLAHAVAGLRYPQDRTGLYFFPLLAVVLASLAPRLWWIPSVLAVAFAGWCVVQLNVSHFSCWRYDADTRALLTEIERRHSGKTEPLRLGLSWQFEPATNFYRETRHWSWLERVTRQGPSPGLDAYLLIDSDRGLVKSLGLTVERTGAVSGTVLAFPSK